MKKLFVIALAAIGMVACVNNEITELPQGNAISFDNAFIDNATRAELTATNLTEFNVWGYIEAESNQTAALFEGVKVSKSAGNWQYEGGARYWAPGLEHNFQAIAPCTAAVVAEHADGEVSAINYTVDGESDLIYADYSKVGAAAGSNNAPVSFTFGHILSKVNFEFVNGFAAEDGITINVKNVKMTVPASGKYDVATETWSVDATTGTTLENCEGCEKFVLPYDNSYAYTIEFDVDVTYGGVVINKDVHKKSSVMVALEQGTAYNFTATINAETLNMESIEFEVGQVDGWIIGSDSTLGTAYVSTADAFQKAIANPDISTIILTNDINLNDAVLTRSVTDPVTTIAANKTVTIDLNTYTLSATSSSTGKNYNMFDVRGTLTVKNGTMEYKHVGNNMAWNNFAEIFYVGFNGTLNLDGVTAKNLGGSDMAYVIDMVNATNITVNVKNSTLESTYIPIRIFNNSKTGVNNVAIKNSTLKGKYCFWVQYWLADGRDEATLAQTLKLDFFNSAEGESNGNTFTYANDYDAPVLYGFNEAVYFDQYGNKILILIPILDAEGNEVAGVAYDPASATEVGGETVYTTIVVTAAAGMNWFANEVDNGDSFEGKTIKLDTDIILPEGTNWEPIGDNRTEKAFSGTFDGQNHLISGAKKSSFDGSVFGSEEGWGIFSLLDGATVKNLRLENEVFASYTVISGTVAGYAQNTNFENIEISNSKISGYNWYTGGVVGWASGNCTFKDIKLDETVSVGSLWDSHGQNAGGIAGGVSGSGTYLIEDCDIACVLDVINDVTSNYKWYIYRVAGMIIGDTNTTETSYNTVVTATATNVTCKNVTVTYGKWMNYHYCEEYGNRGWGRVEASDYVSFGIPEDHTHSEGKTHYECIPFDQLFGGSSNGSGHYPVKGLASFEGVTVNYPAEYTCPLCGQQHNVK